MKGLFIKGDNQYGVIDYFITGMRKDLESEGHKTHLLNLSDTSNINIDEQALECDFILSFNGLGCDLQVNNQPLFNYINKPVFMFLVDHPMHIMKRLLGQKCTLLCVDESHTQFARMCGLNAHFFPHALSAVDLNTAPQVQYADKLNQALMPCSYQDPESFKLALQPIWQQIEPALSAATNTEHFLVNIGVLPYQNQPPRLGIDANVLAVITNADLYLRATNRQQLIANFQQHFPELPLVIQGSNVDAYEHFLHHGHTIPGTDVIAVQQSIKNSRYLLHQVPNFSTALHERILFAVANNTVVICDSLQSVARVDASLRLLDLNAANLPNEQQWQDMVEHNREQVASNHTWKARFDLLFNTFPC